MNCIRMLSEMRYVENCPIRRHEALLAFYEIFSDHSLLSLHRSSSCDLCLNILSSLQIS